MGPASLNGRSGGDKQRAAASSPAVSAERAAFHVKSLSRKDVRGVECRVRGLGSVCRPPGDAPQGWEKRGQLA